MNFLQFSDVPNSNQGAAQAVEEDEEWWKDPRVTKWLDYQDDTFNLKSITSEIHPKLPPKII